MTRLLRIEGNDDFANPFPPVGTRVHDDTGDSATITRRIEEDLFVIKWDGNVTQIVSRDEFYLWGYQIELPT